MLLTLEPLQALEGDCLLLHWGTVADPRLAVIDGGPGNVYENALRPRLETIRANRGIARLPIDLVMVSHVDNDHVVGIKKLFAQLKREIDDNVGTASRHFTVKRLWHNTFNDILGDAIDKFYKTLTASVEASVGGKPNPVLVEKLTKAFKKKNPAAAKADEAAFDIALVLAGHGETRELRDSFEFLFAQNQIATLNAPFKKNGEATLITTEMTPQAAEINGLKFKVAGPMQPEIDKLQSDFDTFITNKGLVEASLLAAYSDDSIPNLSSIVTLLELGGKRIFLTGDARGDKTIKGLTAAGLLSNGPLKVDILKAPHHRSDRNVKQDYFEKIIADTYIFSADGKNGNPDRDTFTFLSAARGKTAKYDIVLTYPIDEIDEKRKEHALQHGQPFTHANHSLEVFFAKCKQDGFNFNVHEGPAVPIDLGDEPMPW
jgi:hypothetical protein